MLNGNAASNTGQKLRKVTNAIVIRSGVKYGSRDAAIATTRHKIVKPSSSGDNCAESFNRQVGFTLNEDRSDLE
jgi:hypothetical protein